MVAEKNCWRKELIHSRHILGMLSPKRISSRPQNLRESIKLISLDAQCHKCYGFMARCKALQSNANKYEIVGYISIFKQCCFFKVKQTDFLTRRNHVMNHDSDIRLTVQYCPVTRKETFLIMIQPDWVSLLNLISLSWFMTVSWISGPIRRSAAGECSPCPDGFGPRWWAKYYFEFYFYPSLASHARNRLVHDTSQNILDPSTRRERAETGALVPVWTVSAWSVPMGVGLTKWILHNTRTVLISAWVALMAFTFQTSTSQDSRRVQFDTEMFNQF